VFEAVCGPVKEVFFSSFLAGNFLISSLRISRFLSSSFLSSSDLRFGEIAGFIMSFLGKCLFICDNSKQAKNICLASERVKNP